MTTDPNLLDFNFSEEDAIAALMEDAISETLTDEQKFNLDSYLKSDIDY
tara:strand:+ start:168 stop:314 length:147 start_codon:yes stop_codon:yes gene_type:complete